jgi:predicted DNA-binding protein (MmcQ/YjbR family)
VMVEKLGSNPTVKERGVATTRHDKWFARFMDAERRLCVSLKESNV